MDATVRLQIEPVHHLVGAHLYLASAKVALDAPRALGGTSPRDDVALRGRKLPRGGRHR